MRFHHKLAKKLFFRFSSIFDVRADVLYHLWQWHGSINQESASYAFLFSATLSLLPFSPIPPFPFASCTQARSSILLTSLLLSLTSLNTLTDSVSYEGAQYTNYGYEYHPGSDGDIVWSIDRQPTWKILSSAIGPDPSVDVGQRDISNEPMAIILVSSISNCIFHSRLTTLRSRRTWRSLPSSKSLNGASS